MFIQIVRLRHDLTYFWIYSEYVHLPETARVVAQFSSEVVQSQ